MLYTLHFMMWFETVFQPMAARSFINKSFIYLLIYCLGMEWKTVTCIEHSQEVMATVCRLTISKSKEMQFQLFSRVSLQMAPPLPISDAKTLSFIATCCSKRKPTYTVSRVSPEQIDWETKLPSAQICPLPTVQPCNPPSSQPEILQLQILY